MSSPVLLVGAIMFLPPSHDRDVPASEPLPSNRHFLNNLHKLNQGTVPWGSIPEPTGRRNRPLEKLSVRFGPPVARAATTRTLTLRALPPGDRQPNNADDLGLERLPARRDAMQPRNVQFNRAAAGRQVGGGACCRCDIWREGGPGMRRADQRLRASAKASLAWSASAALSKAR